MAPIETEGLSKRYGDLVAVEPLTFQARRGEILGLLGPNGAGKSTTIKMLVGLVHPSRGRAWILGHDVALEGPAAREHVGYLPEVVGLYEQLTAEAYLRYVGRFHGITGAPATNRIEELLARVRLSQAASREISTFSKGMRQRLALAGALVHDPDVLILDEPLTGLDPEGIVKMKQAIQRLGGQRTVFLSSHELHAVESLCDRALILRDGEVLADASLEELTRQDPVRFSIRTASPVEDPRALETVEGVRSIDGQAQGERWRLAVDDEAAVSRVVERLVAQDVAVVEVQRDRRSLEEAFVDITGVRT